MKKGLVIATLLLVVGGFWCFSNCVKAAPETGITVGKTAPGFSLNNLDGNQVTIGKAGVTVINFWATWCPPCRQEMPELDAFAKKNADKVLFAAVNLQESGAKVKEFMAKSGFSMQVLLDEEGQAGDLFKIRAIPTTIILDANGVIKFRKAGTVTATELEDVLAEIEK